MKLFLSIVCLVASFAAVADERPTLAPLYLEDMTWTEVRDAIASGHTTIIVPVGGTEQNGPHMVLGKHNLRASALAGRIAARLGNALVAPVISYVPEGRVDPPAGHMRFPGTISISDDAFKGLLEGAARSFRRAGFHDVVLIGDHGGYQGDLAAVAAKLDREWAGSSARVHFVAEYYRTSAEPYAQILREHGITAEQSGVHAGTADTSLAMAVDPRLVRVDRLGATPVPGDGVAGDPRPSTAALGRLGVDLIVARTVAAIRRVVTR